MGAGVNRVATVAMVSVVLLGTSALGYGVARATSDAASGPVGTADRAALEPDRGTDHADRDPDQAADQAANRAARTVRCSAR